MATQQATAAGVGGEARPQGFVIPGLALADLRHEWILNLCLVLAIAAILAPLMLLLGLRHGTIEMLRDQLINDPTYRSIWPEKTVNLTPDWFERIGGRPDVAFVLPTILRGASILRTYRPDSQEYAQLDLIPTGPGDPLLLENGGAIPEKGQIVLSLAAAERLGVEQGATVVLEVDRFRDGKREAEKMDATVISVLSPRADALERIYAPLSFVTAVETYREGMAVPEYGWSGGAPVPYASFDGLMVFLAQPLEPLDLGNLRINTGFSVAEALDPAAFQRRTGFALAAGIHGYDLTTQGQPVLNSSLQQVKKRLRGRGALYLPYVEPREITIDGKPVTAVGLSLTAEEAARLGIDAPPWGGYSEEAAPARLARVLLPAGTAEPGANETGAKLAAAATLKSGSVAFPLEVAGVGAVPTVPLEMLSTLRTGDERDIAWSEDKQLFLLARSGYFGFRLFAHSIDEVPALHRDLVGEGLEVGAHVQEIERIRILDEGLIRLFWLVAAVGIVGGCAALVASLYAAVQRKTRELGVMRLMGLSRRQVFAFPVYQAAVLSLLSALLASAAFLTLSGIINGVFASELLAGQSICSLPPEQHLYAIGATVGAALLSSLFAARKTTRIEPAEAIRAE